VHYHLSRLSGSSQENWWKTDIDPGCIKKGDKFDFEDDIIGIVILNYGGYLPSPVKEFLRVENKS
jgi:hypothetical protein